MERRIRALGINVEEEGKIENEEIMRALDRSETRVMILGQKDDKLFLEEIKKNCVTFVLRWMPVGG